MKASIYLDTSVVNSLFADDAPELKAITIDLFDTFIKAGIYNTFVSDFVVQEINQTPKEEKRNQLLQVLIHYPIDFIALADLKEIEKLASLYIAEKAIPENKLFDALHVAVAVICKIDFVVSWNFKHLANVGRERKILAVNYRHNYFNAIRIVTPLELLDYGI